MLIDRFSIRTYIYIQNLGKIIGGTVAGVVGAVAIPVTLPLLGFTSAGVAAGSIAASIQSAVYGAWTGGVFALAQEWFSENFDYQKLIKINETL